jgi:hypothetical protein
MKTPKILQILFIILGVGMLAFSAFQLIHGLFDPTSAGLSLANFTLASIADSELTTFEMTEGEENMGGFTQVAYLGLRSHITGYPTLPSEESTTLEELVALVGDYSFAADKHFIKILAVPGGLQLNPESQGEYPGAKSFKLSGSFIISGMRAKQRAIARLLNNCYGVLIIPEEDGTRLNIGTQMRPVHFTPKGKSGQKAADTKVFEFEFTTDSFVPGYTYNGVIALDGETLPAVS